MSDSEKCNLSVFMVIVMSVIITVTIISTTTSADSDATNSTLTNTSTVASTKVSMSHTMLSITSIQTTNATPSFTELQVTSRAAFPRFQSLTLDEPEKDTESQFVEIHAGQRDHCSLELSGGTPDCNWWNMVDGDDSDFLLTGGTDCITRGVRSSESAVFYVEFEKKNVSSENRALLISPIIKRETKSVLLTLWYIFKCSGTYLRIHRIPVTNPFGQQAIGARTVVAEITEPANHIEWEFKSFEFSLPESQSAYQIVVEGILSAEINCSSFTCGSDSRRSRKSPLKPSIGLDSLTIEPLNGICDSSSGSDIMNCGFQASSGDKTMCEWISSIPQGFRSFEGFGGLSRDLFADWKPQNTGSGSTHGATAQHLQERGYILSFDASGKAMSEGYIQTPLLVASNNCSCEMTFLYLMRGEFTPRMQVNVIFGKDTDDDTREKEPQWSLHGHQGDDWLKALVKINLQVGEPFQIEIRVMDITHSLGDVHLDDVTFNSCAMTKFNSTAKL